MTDKMNYRILCKNESSVFFFNQDWWLDVVCGEENWDVVIVKKGEQIVGSFPYYTKKEYSFFSGIGMPKLTQTMGPWIKYPEGQKYVSKLSYEKEIMSELIEKLPEYDFFTQNFHHSVTNWLPFYWKGFQQTTRYTYLLDLSLSEDSLLENMKSSVRNKIRNAEKKLDVLNELPLPEVYRLNEKTFVRQGLDISFSYDFFLRMDQTLVKNKRREIFVGLDESKRAHSCLYLVWDNSAAYVHLVGEDPELRSSGAGMLLIWSAIKYAKNVLKLRWFDFEGSMLENVEAVRRSFGAVQTPYFQVTKVNSKILKRIYNVKGLIRP
jgi:hypothetical protein